MAESIITIDGHILDSLLFPKVLDIIIAGGAEYEIVEIEVGRTRYDVSHARIRVSMDNAVALKSIVALTKEHGAKERV
jgi:hypothetical protein